MTLSAIFTILLILVSFSTPAYSVTNGHTPDISDVRARMVVMVESYVPETDLLHHCTGVIIDKRIIVTSGHCLKSNPNNTEVFFGRSKKTVTEAIKVKMLQISRGYRDPDEIKRYRHGCSTKYENIVHGSKREYLSLVASDYGFIYLEKNIPTGYVAAKLYNFLDGYQTDYGSIVGYSPFDDRSEDLDQLGTYQLQVSSRPLELQIDFDNNLATTIGSYANADNESHTNRGDSGGPLFISPDASQPDVEPRLIGITSGGGFGSCPGNRNYSIYSITTNPQFLDDLERFKLKIEQSKR